MLSMKLDPVNPFLHSKTQDLLDIGRLKRVAGERYMINPLTGLMELGMELAVIIELVKLVRILENLTPQQ